MFEQSLAAQHELVLTGPLVGRDVLGVCIRGLGMSKKHSAHKSQEWSCCCYPFKNLWCLFYSAGFYFHFVVIIYLTKDSVMWCCVIMSILFRTHIYQNVLCCLRDFIVAKSCIFGVSNKHMSQTGYLSKIHTQPLLIQIQQPGQWPLAFVTNTKGTLQRRFEMHWDFNFLQSHPIRCSSIITRMRKSDYGRSDEWGMDQTID